MSDIQPLVNIQFSPSGVDLNNNGFGGGVGGQNALFGQNASGFSIGSSPWNGTTGVGAAYPTALSQFCSPSVATNPATNPNSGDMQSIAKQFSAALESIIASFKNILDTLLSRLQSTAGTTTGTPATGTASGTSNTPASTGTTSNPSTTTSTTTGSQPSTSTSSPTSGSSTPTTSTPSSTSSTPASTSSASSSSAKPVKQLGKTGQFLWKPKAEKDGKLVVLLPKKFGRAKAVRVLSPDGKTVLASGKFSGVANGERAHYRFSKAGADFPKGSIVEIVRQNGQKEQLTISDPSKRLVH